jgi:cytoskeletal protein RodZ
MGISLAEAEAATHIRQEHLAPMESGEWHLLPGRVVCRELLRVYAEFLEMDLYELHDIIERLCNVAGADTIVDEEPKPGSLGRNVLYTLVLVVGVAILAWFALRASQIIIPRATPIPPAPTDTPTPEPTFTPTPAPSNTPTPTPEPPTATPTPACMEEYTVVSGDVLSAIAARFGVTVEAIQAASELTDPNRLSVGQVLCIPWPATPEP